MDELTNEKTDSRAGNGYQVPPAPPVLPKVSVPLHMSGNTVMPPISSEPPVVSSMGMTTPKPATTSAVPLLNNDTVSEKLEQKDLEPPKVFSLQEKAPVKSGVEQETPVSHDETAKQPSQKNQSFFKTLFSIGAPDTAPTETSVLSSDMNTKTLSATSVAAGSLSASATSNITPFASDTKTPSVPSAVPSVTTSSAPSNVTDENTEQSATEPQQMPAPREVAPLKNDSEQKEQSTITETSDQPFYKNPNFFKTLFSNGNECITAPAGSFPIKEDMRTLLALFSNGRFFVSETYKFDGKVLGFEYLAKKRRLQIGAPEYVPMAVLENIYNYAAKIKTPVVEEDEEVQEQARMQRDFITIISRAAFYRVSDIHVIVADRTTIMFRVNGLMQTEMEYNKEWGESFVRAAFASSDISDSNYAQNEYQAAQKLGRTPLRGSGGKLVLPKNVLGIRLQFNPIAFGSRYVIMRLLYAEDSSAQTSSLESLGFTKKETDILYRLRALPTGIVIVSGPTGSGKSTTLQRNMIAMLQERNFETNLITVEDPPEYPIPGARQMPVTNAMVEEAKDREFTKALSAALRSDPDSLMIGEVRTLSSADLAFRGVLSGHNVWTTLHANSAPAILTRLKDLGVEDFKLQDPEVIKGLLAQRLFRKNCPYCRIAAKDKPNHPAVQRLRTAFGDIGMEYAYLRGAGCKHCDFRGVKGRTVVAEFILPDTTFLDLMIKGETKKAVNYWISDLNGQTLRESAQQRMLEGIIDIEEVERWTGFLDQLITA